MKNKAKSTMKKGKKPKKGKLFKALHTGTWGGMFSKILYALAALIGGFLPISGYYIWWKRTSSKKRRRKRSAQVPLSRQEYLYLVHNANKLNIRMFSISK